MGPFNMYETLDIAFLNPFPPYKTLHPPPTLFGKNDLSLESESSSTYVCTGNIIA